MSLTPERKRYLLGNCTEIYHRMLIDGYWVFKRKKYNGIQAYDEFLKRVYEKNFSEDRQELFLIGAFAECFYRIMQNPQHATENWFGEI
jgi:hypothetical protein